MVSYIIVCTIMLVSALIVTIIMAYRVDRFQMDEWQDMRQDLMGDIPTQELTPRHSALQNLRRRPV